MIPRGRIDIGWLDLASAAATCALPSSREALERRVSDLWSPGGDALVCLSVRSGLDLLLSVVEYPKGSEILVSAVTIRDMVRIVTHHGLVPVPVDLDMQALSLPVDALRRAAGPRTRAILAAHLFGSRMPLDAVGAFARERGLLLVEDVAQSFTGLEYRGSPASDVSLFSFGPIKTGTALGGATVRVKDPALRARMKERQSRYPVQGRGRFFKRTVRFFVVRLALSRSPFTALCALSRLLGRDHDEVISRSVRGFPGPDFLANIRHQPSAPLLALLLRRLSRFDSGRVARRMALAERMADLAPRVARPGRAAVFHSHWTFPILCEAPDDLVKHLWERGFDATRGTWSLYPVPPVPGRPDVAAPEAHRAMDRIVYLPVYPGVSERDLARLAAALGEFGGLATSADVSKPDRREPIGRTTTTA
jgi:perosamine synthetase